MCIYIYIVSLYFYVPDEGSLLPKYRDCITYNDFEIYLMCCGVMLLLLIIYICIYLCVSAYVVVVELPQSSDDGPQQCWSCKWKVDWLITVRA